MSDQEEAVEPQDEPQDEATHQDEPRAEDNQDTPQDKPDPAKARLLSDLYKERDRRKAYATRVDELTAELEQATARAGELDSVTAERDDLRNRYDRLEAFVLNAGGELSGLLDSRRFTQELFESDRDVSKIVADWHKANPSPTSAALKPGAAHDKPAVDINELLRAAAR